MNEKAKRVKNNWHKLGLPEPEGWFKSTCLRCGESFYSLTERKLPIINGEKAWYPYICDSCYIPEGGGADFFD